MKMSLFITAFLLMISLTFAQDKNKYEFVGALHTSTQDIISYKIKFNEIGDGKIEGVSQTDFYGKNNTSTKITGTLNLKKNTLSFHEVNNISSHSNEDENIFCYVHVKDLKIRSVKGKRIIQGEFKGLYKSGENCASGSIYLAGTELLEALNISNDSLRKLDSMVQAQSSMKNMKYLKRNDKLQVSWQGDKIIFDVWDGSKEDNDSINIYFNDRLIESNLLIKNNKKTIEIPFEEGGGVLKVLALNEGDAGTNSVNFAFKNGNNLTPIMSNLKKGEQVFIEFTR